MKSHDPVFYGRDAAIALFAAVERSEGFAALESAGGATRFGVGLSDRDPG